MTLAEAVHRAEVEAVKSYTTPMSARDTMEDYADNVWRVGTKLGRTIYAVLEKGAAVEPGTEDCDVFLGMMETRELAQDVVDAHNDNLSPPIHVREAIAERHGLNRG